MSRLINWYLGLVQQPPTTIRSIIAAQPVLAGLITVLIGVGLSIAIHVASNDFRNEDDATAISRAFPPLVAIIFAIAIVLLWTGIVHLIAKLFGGRGMFWGAFSAFAIISIFPSVVTLPLAVLILSILTLPLPTLILAGFILVTGLLPLVGIPMVLFPVYLVAIVIRENYQLDTGKAIIALILSVVVLAIVLQIVSAAIEFARKLL